MSLNGALATATRSLDLFTLGIQVAGHNIANASTPGFVRDQLAVESTGPFRQGNVLIGSGARATGVTQQLDRYLESRIHSANTEFASADSRRVAYLQLQTALQELGGSDLSSSLNNFLGTLQDVVNQPDSASTRAVAIEQGKRFATDVSSLRTRIEEIRDTYSSHVGSLVEEANTLIQTISGLNPQIARLEANGLAQNDAGSLRIQRLNALQRLSEIIPVRVQEMASGSIDVFSGSDYLIIDGTTQKLETVSTASSTETSVNVQFSRTRAPVTTAGGELGGLLEARDSVLAGFVDQLDQFVGSVIYEFNKIHASGEGLVGFTSVTGTEQVNNANAALSSAGLPFTPQHGSFQVKVRATATGITSTSTINVDLDGIGTDTSLNDLQAALDGLGHVTASVTSDGRLQLAADGGYEITFSNDTSGTLAALGINTFFTGSDSDTIGVNALIQHDQRFLATGRGGGPADNTNAVALSQFIDQPVAKLGHLSLDEFYNQVIGTVAQSASAEGALADGLEAFRDSLKTQREQRSGVNLDEEAVKIIALQRNYQAAAKIISTIDELLNTLINMVG